MKTRQIIIKYLSVVSILFLFNSCTSLKYKIKRNNKYTNKIIKKVFYKNKNVFYILPHYSNISFVWTHTKDSVIVYRLVDGKFINKYFYKQPKTSIILPSKKEYYHNLKHGCVVIHGDIVGYIISVNDKKVKNEIPMNITCFKKTKYKSKFLIFLQKDMIKYNIWNWKKQ